MYCKRCAYDLRGAPEGRCPECGRPFDPARPETWGAAWHDRWRWLDRAVLGVGLYPLLTIGLIHGSYLLGRLELGHWPIPYADDPKGLSPVVRIAGMTGILSGVLWLPLFAGNIALLGAGAFLRANSDDGRWRAWLVRLCLCSLTWIGSVFFVREDPLNVTCWLFD